MAAAQHEGTQNARKANKVMPGFIHHKDAAGTCGCHGNDFMAEGSDALLDRRDQVMADEFEAKMLGRVGRGHSQNPEKDNTLARG